MTLIQQIKDKQIAARKSGDSLASLYTTLLGEASIIGKNAGNRETTDVEVVAVVKKFIKNIDETVQALTSRGQDAYVYMQEKRALEAFLPSQLGEDQLRDIAASRASDMPSFMKFLKENHAGRYDGKMASSVAKSVYAK